MRSENQTEHFLPTCTMSIVTENACYKKEHWSFLKTSVNFFLYPSVMKPRVSLNPGVRPQIWWLMVTAHVTRKRAEGFRPFYANHSLAKVLILSAFRAFLPGYTKKIFVSKSSKHETFQGLTIKLKFSRCINLILVAWNASTTIKNIFSSEQS